MKHLKISNARDTLATIIEKYFLHGKHKIMHVEQYISAALVQNLPSLEKIIIYFCLS